MEPVVLSKRAPVRVVVVWTPVMKRWWWVMLLVTRKQRDTDGHNGRLTGDVDVSLNRAGARLHCARGQWLPTTGKWCLGGRLWQGDSVGGRNWTRMLTLGDGNRRTVEMGLYCGVDYEWLERNWRMGWWGFYRGAPGARRDAKGLPNGSRRREIRRWMPLLGQ